MFGSIGGFEMIALLAIGLLVFGPKRLPEMGRWLARGLSELRKAATEIKDAVEKEADLSEVTRAASDLKQAVNIEARRLFTDLENEPAPPRRSLPPADPPAGQAKAEGEEKEEPASEPRGQNGR